MARHRRRLGADLAGRFRAAARPGCADNRAPGAAAQAGQPIRPDHDGRPRTGARPRPCPPARRFRGDETAERLRRFVERFENLAEEKAAISDDQKQVMAEAKAEGFDPKALRKCVAIRKKKAGDYHDEQALTDLYLSALGIVAEPPLFAAVNRIGVDILARESVVEALKGFVPDHGSITVEKDGVRVRLTRDEDGNVAAHELPAAGDDPDNVVRLKP
jgi:uncharacterized protein (UPF0335 family)